MSQKRRIARYITLIVGGLLCVVGVLHDIVNVPYINRAIARGEIAERMGAQLVANVALAGLALALVGVLLVLISPELGRGKQFAWRLGIVIGMFLALGSVAAYWWLPRERILVFAVLGCSICAPLLIWRKEFLAE